MDFSVSADGRLVRARRSVDVPLDTVRRLLVGDVTPRVLSHLGSFVLHASAFATEAGVVAVLGDSGAGKSTLSAYFALHGAPIVSDDVLVVEWVGGSMLAMPTGSGVSVWSDTLEVLRQSRSTWRLSSRASKRCLGVADGLALTHARAPIRRMYLLDSAPAARIEVSPLSAREAALALVSQSYVLDTRDRNRLRDQFCRVCGNVPAVDIRRLRYPRAFDLLPDVHHAIIADLANGPGGSTVFRAERLPR